MKRVDVSGHCSRSSNELLAELIEEITARIEAGQHFELATYQTRYPSLADQLAQLVPALHALEELGMSAASHVRTTHHSDVAPDGRLGDFRLIREIGRGGMGIVYEAEQLSLQRRMALKILPFAAILDSQQLLRFKIEARAAAILDHPHIVAVHSVGEQRGVHYYAMQLINGQSLAELIALRAKAAETNHQLCDLSAEVQVSSKREEDNSEKAGSPLADTDTVAALSTAHAPGNGAYSRIIARLIAEGATALEHAHKHGIVHRDVKPGNLLLDAHGSLYVTDFGLAQIESDAEITMTGDLLGTLRYMSPEQASGKPCLIDHRTDIYSLGATLYELLSLQPLHSGANRGELLQSIAFKDPTPLRQINSKIPVDLETIVCKATEKQPEARYSTAQEFADDLMRFIHHRPIQARVPSTIQKIAKWSRRHEGIVYTGMVGLFILAITLGTAVLAIARSRNEAVRLRAVAEAAAQRAEQQENLATVQRDHSLRQHYVSSIRLAYSDWQAGHIPRMADTLEELVPRDQSTSDMRGWEWYYLRSLLMRNENGFDPELGAVRQVGWSPDGRYFAAAGERGVKIFDSNSRLPIATFSDWYKFDWHPGGIWLAGWTKARAAEIQVWNVPAAQIVKRSDTWWGNESTSNQLPERITDLKWDPVGKTLAWTAGQSLYLWNVEESDVARCRHTKTSNTTGFCSLAWRPDGQALVVGASYPGHLMFWIASTSQFEHEERIPVGEIRELAWHADTGELALTTAVGQLMIWNANTKVAAALDGHRGFVNAVSWNPAGDEVVSAGEDNLIRIWNVESGQQSMLLAGHTAQVHSVDWSPAGNQIASGGEDGVIRFWDTKDMRDARSIGPGYEISWDPSGNYIGTSRAYKRNPSHEHKTVREISVLDAKTGEVRLTLDKMHYGTRVSWSPDGHCIAVGDDMSSKTSLPNHGSVGIWNALTGRKICQVAQAHRTAKSSYSYCRAIVWAPDSERFATGGTDRVVKVWDAHTGKLLNSLVAHTATVGSLAWSPDGCWLASADWRHGVKIWNAKTWTLQWAMDPPKKALLGSNGGPAIAWSSDSARLASRFGHGRLVVWRISTDHPPETDWAAKAHTSRIRSVAWSPDDRRIATLSLDRLLKIWDADSGEELLALDRQLDGAYSVAWSPDGKQLASNWSSGELLIWDASPAMDRARE